MYKNCQYSMYGVISDRIEQQNQEFCVKLERSINGYNMGRNGNNIIRINNDKKGRTTFYRAVRLVFSKYYWSVDDKKCWIEDPFKKQDPFISDKQIYIQNINKRIIANQYNKISSKYNFLVKEYTIFCSRGSYVNVLVEQLNIDRERSENENNTENNGGENKNSEQKDLMVEG